MDSKELQLIKELMDKLSEEMEYGEEDFSERLGRKKPEVQVLKVEGEMPMDSDESPEMSDEMDELDMEHEGLEDLDMEESSPEQDLKRRLMKLRG